MWSHEWDAENIESVTAPNGEKTSYLYDGEGRLTEEYLLDGPHRLL